MIQAFTKRYSQTDCSIFLKILYLAPGSSKEFCTNMGFFVQSQIYHLQLCDIVQMRYLFCGFSFSTQNVDSGNYSYKEVDKKSRNYRQSNNHVITLVSSFVSFTNYIKVVSITDCYIHYKIF